MPIYEVRVTAEATIGEIWHVEAKDQEAADEAANDDLHRHTFVSDWVVGNETNREIAEVNLIEPGSNPQVVHKITYLWGESPDPGDTAKTYEFQTTAELDAFIKGVEESAGWLEVRIAPEGFVVPDTGFEADDLEVTN